MEKTYSRNVKLIYGTTVYFILNKKTVNFFIDFIMFCIFDLIWNISNILSQMMQSKMVSSMVSIS